MSFILPLFKYVVNFDPFLEPPLLLYVPLFSPLNLIYAHPLALYSITGTLLGRAPLLYLSYVDLNFQFIVLQRDILRRPENSLPRTHVELIRLLQRQVRLVSQDFPVTPE